MFVTHLSGLLDDVLEADRERIVELPRKLCLATTTLIEVLT